MVHKTLKSYDSLLRESDQHLSCYSVYDMKYALASALMRVRKVTRNSLIRTVLNQMIH